MTVLLETNLPNLFYRGKVRDTYDLGDTFLMVATDRISAFDVVLPSGIPDKGKVLNQLSAFWFEKTESIVPNHMVRVIKDVGWLKRHYGDVWKGESLPASLDGRSMVVKKAERVPVECVVRGYISGSAWADYRKTGEVCGLRLPAGLLESEKLPHPIFTPTTKAESGHDLPLSQRELIKLVGADLAKELKEKSLTVYDYAHHYALARGIIIADTKMEFGFIEDKLTLIDELLTPDSSRFWDTNSYGVGRSQASYDKQLVRDWLVRSGWNMEPPAPELPKEVIRETTERYRQAFRRLTGWVLR